VANQKFTREVRDKAKFMYIEGNSFREIAKEIGCTHGTASKWCKNEGWETTREEIDSRLSDAIAHVTFNGRFDKYNELIESYDQMLQKGREALSQSDSLSAKEGADLMDKAIKGMTSLHSRKYVDEIFIRMLAAVREGLEDDAQVEKIGRNLRLYLQDYF